MEDKHYYVGEAGTLGGTERLMSAALITRRSFQDNLGLKTEMHINSDIYFLNRRSFKGKVSGKYSDNNFKLY